MTPIRTELFANNLQIGAASKSKVAFPRVKSVLAPSSFPSDCSKAGFLLRFFFV